VTVSTPWEHEMDCCGCHFPRTRRPWEPAWGSKSCSNASTHRTHILAARAPRSHNPTTAHCTHRGLRPRRAETPTNPGLNGGCCHSGMFQALGVDQGVQLDGPSLRPVARLPLGPARAPWPAAGAAEAQASRGSDMSRGWANGRSGALGSFWAARASELDS
jgi:hypothetical protein